MTSLSSLLNGTHPLPDCNTSALDAAQLRQNQLTKPQGSLGRLEELALWMASWQGTDRPTLDAGSCLIFAGNHGITKRGISAFPADVTAQMVANFTHGGAAINQLCDTAGLTLSVTPLSLETPTADFSAGPAMSHDDVLSAFQAGIDAIPSNCDYLVFGEMGIGNTTSAAALCAALFGGQGADWAGRGTGLDDEAVAAKAAVIDEALLRHGRSFDSPQALLSAYGGRELAAIAGGVLGARARRIPVMLDGYVCCAAAASLTLLNNVALDHCQISHLSAEQAHGTLSDALGKTPLLSLNMRLGEASGGAVATLLVRAALATHNGMASFAEAGVSGG
ncbi:MAG: Nicotinate-nucleotide--dimethylbenzimidazole phosphoribosyltransferase [Alphaproteobacteria bacterium UBA4588]|nr:MAG: Nicotinate-nucleotide--dimethylbenzimidazole phosphoribosyltransferase [Alphaproteobacteria bacterium UBA4588]